MIPAVPLIQSPVQSQHYMEENPSTGSLSYTKNYRKEHYYHG